MPYLKPDLKLRSLTQQYVKLRGKEVLLKRFRYVLIRSQEHGAWWRPDGRGYTTLMDQAGVYTAEEAWQSTGHCGREKQIVYYEVRTPAGFTGVEGQAIKKLIEAIDECAKLGIRLCGVGDTLMAMGNQDRDLATSAADDDGNAFPRPYYAPHRLKIKTILYEGSKE